MLKAIAGVALVASSAAGLALFPHALEPGRSERDGIVLSMLVDQGSGTRPTDWYTASPGTRARRSGSYLRIMAGRLYGFHLVSRPLPVYSHQRYAVALVARHVSRPWRLVIWDATLTRRIATLRIPARERPRRLRLVFATGGLRRVSLSLHSPGRAKLELRDLRLIRL